MGGDWKEGDPDPSFEEFVIYLIKTKVQEYNVHWSLISPRCSVCELSYRYFIKFENMEAEWKQMLEDSGITEDLQIGWENASGGVKGSMDYSQYYQNITNDDIIKLYEKFLPDFLAF